MRKIIWEKINVLHLHPELLLLFEGMHHSQLNTTSQSQEKGLSADNQPHVLTAKFLMAEKQLREAKYLKRVDFSEDLCW